MATSLRIVSPVSHVDLRDKAQVGPVGQRGRAIFLLFSFFSLCNKCAHKISPGSVCLAGVGGLTPLGYC